MWIFFLIVCACWALSVTVPTGLYLLDAAKSLLRPAPVLVPVLVAKGP